MISRILYVSWNYCIFLTKTYAVWDYLFYDCATDNTKESSWFVSNSVLESTYTGDGRTVTKNENNSNSRYYFLDTNVTSSTKVGGRYSIPKNYVIEFEITDIDEINFNFMSDEVDAKNKTINATGKWKIEYNGLTVEIYKDTSFFQSISLSGNYLRFGFNMAKALTYVTFKNFRVYPL